MKRKTIKEKCPNKYKRTLEIILEFFDVIDNSILIEEYRVLNNSEDNMEILATKLGYDRRTLMRHRNKINQIQEMIIKRKMVINISD